MNPKTARVLVPVLIICFFPFSHSVLAGPASFFSGSKGLQVLEEIQDAISSLAEQVTPTVVNVSPIRHLGPAVNVPKQRSSKTPGSGSGVIIHEDGFIVTNNHVVANVTEAEIGLSDDTTLIARIIGRDPDTDLALLKVESPRKLPSATFGNSSTVKVGQWVLAVGNPFGLDQTVTLGVVSGVGRENMNLSRYENFIQTDASINPGNSGGPLFNIRGEVIGINTAIINFAQGIGFAIPSNMVDRIIGQLRAGGKVVRGWLGVGIQPLTPELGEKFGVVDGKGILVNEVFEGDPAEQAGVRSGDIIIKIGKEPVETPNQLSRVVASIGPGEQVTITVIRDNQEKSFPVSLGVKKEQAIVTSLMPSKTQVDLGIDVAPITDNLAEQFKIQEKEGILVTGVARGSLAYTEGLRKGDIISEINRTPVPTIQEFSNAMDEVRPGETILLRILRESSPFFVVLRPKS